MELIGNSTKSWLADFLDLPPAIAAHVISGGAETLQECVRFPNFTDSRQHPLGPLHRQRQQYCPQGNLKLMQQAQRTVVWNFAV